MNIAKEPIVPALAGIYGLAVPCAHAGTVDATVIQGVNTGGTVRVNMLANLEALLNIIANGCEIILIAVGLVLLYRSGKVFLATKRIPKSRILAAFVFIESGLLTPEGVNFLVAGCRDAGLFS